MAQQGPYSGNCSLIFPVCEHLYIYTNTNEWMWCDFKKKVERRQNEKSGSMHSQDSGLLTQVFNLGGVLWDQFLLIYKYSEIFMCV